MDVDIKSLEMNINGAFNRLNDLPKNSKKVAYAVFDRVKRIDEPHPIGIDIIANELNISARSLQRRLQEEKTEFTDVRNCARQCIAIELLYQGGSSMRKIAQRLGYSGNPSFNAACKSWYQCSPLHLRKCLQNERINIDELIAIMTPASERIKISASTLHSTTSLTCSPS